MTGPHDQGDIWLTAEYTFASVFSCRIPMKGNYSRPKLSILRTRVVITPGQR
jgi:hypothetical protein